MKCEKPMTENQKYYGNILYKYMMKNDVLTKQQMLKFLGWSESKDRQLRELISYIAKKVPVISLSSDRGYKIAKSREDLDAVKHCWAELDSREREIEERKKPLIGFVDKFGGKLYEK